MLDGKSLVALFKYVDSAAEMEFQLPVEASGVEDLLADCVGSQPILTQVEWGKLKVQLPSTYATLLRLVGLKGGVRKMNAAQRRKVILERLTEANAPLSASVLAGELGVSRQIVVGDVALLRAAGTPLIIRPAGAGPLFAGRIGRSGSVILFFCLCHRKPPKIQSAKHRPIC